MKKGIILFGMLSVFAWTSCDNDNNKENTEENTYSSPPPAPAEPAPVVQTPPPAAPKQKDGTTIKGTYTLMDGTILDADQRNTPISVDYYYIVPNKCTECQGFHEEPQCAAVCPVDCCVPDESYRETVEELMSKKTKLHI